MMAIEEKRSILHVDLDTFFVSVERLLNSKLNGKPVIIGSSSDRGVVASCSYEARKYGIYSSMPIKMAKILCPDAIFIKGDMELYSKYSDIVTQIIEEKAPLYEKASIDEHYIDITGMDKFFGCMKWSHELKEYITKQTGLTVSIGLSINKTVSKIATDEAKPNGEKNVPSYEVKHFLNPLSIKKLPMIGEKTYRLLRNMGIETIGTLSQIPPEILEKVLGKNGIIIWKRANGIDETPVKPYTLQKSLSTEITFEKDTADMQKITTYLIKMTEQLCYELRNLKKLTGCITVKIRYSNFDTHTQQKKIGYTSLDNKILPVVKELFNKLYNRRMLIRLVGVRFGDLIYGFEQLKVFENVEKSINLYYTLDKIRNKYGIHSIIRAINMM